MKPSIGGELPICTTELKMAKLLIPDTDVYLAEKSHPFQAFTVSQCEDKGHDRGDAEDEQKCQSFCEAAGPSYKFYVFNPKVNTQGCWIFERSFESYINTCRVVAGPAEPSIGECMSSTDPCKVIYIT